MRKPQMPGRVEPVNHALTVPERGTDRWTSDRNKRLFELIIFASASNPVDLSLFIMAPATTDVQNTAAEAEPEANHGQNLAIRNGNTGRH